MNLYKNTNEKFGESGPFEAESRETLADDMVLLFRSWTSECETDADDFTDADLALIMDGMRTEFIAGLELVTK